MDECQPLLGGGAAGETAQGAGTVYGLTKMAPKEGAPKKESFKKEDSFIGKSLADKELQAFKEDVQDLPDQASMVTRCRLSRRNPC